MLGGRLGGSVSGLLVLGCFPLSSADLASLVDVLDLLTTTSPHQLRWPFVWRVGRFVVVVVATRARVDSALLGVWLVPSSSTPFRSLISSRRPCSCALARGGTTVYFGSVDVAVSFCGAHAFSRVNSSPFVL